MGFSQLLAVWLLVSSLVRMRAFARQRKCFPIKFNHIDGHSYAVDATAMNDTIQHSDESWYQYHHEPTDWHKHEWMTTVFQTINPENETINVSNWNSEGFQESEAVMYKDVEERPFIPWNQTCEHCYWLSNPLKNRATYSAVIMKNSMKDVHLQRTKIDGMSWQSRIPPTLYGGHFDVGYYQPTEMKVFYSTNPKCHKITKRLKTHHGRPMTAMTTDYVVNKLGFREAYYLRRTDVAAEPFASGYDYRRVTFDESISSGWNCILVVIAAGEADPKGNGLALIRNIRLYYENSECQDKDSIFPFPPIASSNNRNSTHSLTQCATQCVVQWIIGFRKKTKETRNLKLNYTKAERAEDMYVRMFRMLNKDGNTEGIDNDVVKDVIRIYDSDLNEAGVNDEIAKVDADGSGRVNLDEFLAWMWESEPSPNRV